MSTLLIVEDDTLSTLLIVEDDTLIMERIIRAIADIDRDIRVLKSNEAIKALKIAEGMEIDVFIIDIGLPDWDGITLAKKIRKSYPYQPIIIESSKNDAQYQNHVHDQIENLAFLRKPYTDEKLIAKVNQALNLAKNLSIKQLHIKQKGFSIFMEINDILYIEKIKNEKKVEVVLYNRDTHCLTREGFVGISLNSLMGMLENKKDLFRCHKGYIINPKMIKKLNYASNTISLKYTEDEIPIGKKFKNDIDLLL